MKSGTPKRRAVGVAVPIVLVAAAIVAALGRPAQAGQPSSRAAAELLRASVPWTAIPGALPSGFPYRYNDGSRGWPVRAVQVQHPIRGSFLDPRGNDNDARGGYHFGVDINVNDEHPDPAAPKGLSQRVYALESGVVSAHYDRQDACGARRLEVGHFSYWHVSPIVVPGQRIRVGQQVGWTCLGEWHAHVSEWQLLGSKRVWVNPLHPGGKLAPYVDTAPPSVAALRFVAPSGPPWKPQVDLAQPDGAVTLPLDRLRGQVELRARIGDPQSVLGFLATDSRFATQFHPYRVAVEIRRVSTGRPVMQRVSFQADQLPDTTSYLVHYAPGTSQNSSMTECVGPPPAPDCRGVYWFRPFSRFKREFWDTTRVPNGQYKVTVFAWDVRANLGSRSALVRVAN